MKGIVKEKSINYDKNDSIDDKIPIYLRQIILSEPTGFHQIAGS